MGASWSDVTEGMSIPELRKKPTTQQLVQWAAGSGDFTIDFEWPEPEPVPVTTIAWRLGHIIVGVFGTGYKAPEALIDDPIPLRSPDKELALQLLKGCGIFRIGPPIQRQLVQNEPFTGR